MLVKGMVVGGKVVPIEERRRIYAEDKAKVVADIWGPEFIQFLAAALTILNMHQDDLKNRMNSSSFSFHPGAINCSLNIILVQNS